MISIFILIAMFISSISAMEYKRIMDIELQNTQHITKPSLTLDANTKTIRYEFPDNNHSYNLNFIHSVDSRNNYEMYLVNYIGENKAIEELNKNLEDQAQALCNNKKLDFHNHKFFSLAETKIINYCEKLIKQNITEPWLKPYFMLQALQKYRLKDSYVSTSIQKIIDNKLSLKLTYLYYSAENEIDIFITEMIAQESIKRLNMLYSHAQQYNEKS